MMYGVTCASATPPVPKLRTRELTVRYGKTAAVRSVTLDVREHEVLALLARGFTNQEIAKQLFISTRTAETHRAHVMQKLRLGSRAELVSYALANGLLES